MKPLLLSSLLLTIVAGPAVAARDSSFALVLNIPAYRLVVLEGGVATAEYRVAVGHPAYPTPTGDFAIDRIEIDPSWTPPASDWAKDSRVTPPGPANPMGRAKMRLLPLYFIHGSPDTLSLGSAASHGCVRMRNPDVLDLARRVIQWGAPGTTDSAAAALLARSRRTRVVMLTRAVRVELRYEPIEVAGGTVVINRDIYDAWSGALEQATRDRLAAALAPRMLASDAMARLVDAMRAMKPTGEPRSVPIDSLAAGGSGAASTIGGTSGSMVADP